MLAVLFYVFLGILCIAVVFLFDIIIKARQEGQRLFDRYDSYTRDILAQKLTLAPHEVRPEFKRLHPWKGLKLFKFCVDSYTGKKCRRVNMLDANMMGFVKMFTCLIHPDHGFNLPMFSADIIFMGKKRVFVIEIIDPAHIEDENLTKHYEDMKKWAPAVNTLEHADVDMQWCKGIVTDFSVHAKADRTKDDLLFDIYTSYLNTYLDMMNNAQPLSDENSRAVSQGLHGYVDSLLEKGGTAVNVFKFLLGPEKQQEYVRSVMFGVD